LNVFGSKLRALTGAVRRLLERRADSCTPRQVKSPGILAPAVAEPPSGAHLLLKVRLGSLADIVSQPVHPTIERPPRVLEKPER
jgi:hypothetical protein